METRYHKPLVDKTSYVGDDLELWKVTANQTQQQIDNPILAHCELYGFQCRFLYESVIIKTPISSWQFDYHKSKKTLRHESTVKVNFETGDYAKTHEQFRDRRISCIDVIDYIAEHDKWRLAHP